MTTLMNFAGHPLIHALGWTLLHFCWQGALVAAVLWCVLTLLAEHSSQARYGAACVAMLLLVALPLITFGRIATAEYAMRTVTSASAIPVDATLLLQVGAGDITAPWPVQLAVTLDHAVPWLLSAWFAGAIFFVVRLNLGLMVARRLSYAGTEPPIDELQQTLDALRRRLGVDRAVRLLYSARVQVPTVIGWLRPVVLIPASCLMGLSTEQVEAILCHELAHVRRHDYLVSVFQSVAEALLFYHPATWWVSKQVRRERECCCDEVAIAGGSDVLAYAKALSYLEERRAAFPEFVLGANGGALSMRIKRLLGCREDAGTSQFAALLLLGLMVTISGSYLATMAQPKPAEAMLASATAPVQSLEERPGQNVRSARPLKPVYASWLSEDVVWIITTEEREAFLRLANDEERDAFINSFWARRDLPDTAAGTYREQHYSRIAYANMHFGAPGHPGWKTDRGHLYILYGKPESVDSHPSGSATGYPFEVWHYPSIAGMGEHVDLSFVDTCRCGVYNYTIDGPGQSGARQPPSNWKAVDSAARIFAPVKVDFEPSGKYAGGIAGVVFDPTGAVVPHAAVRATSVEQRLTMVRSTDGSGKYSLAPLPPGRYAVEVMANGFQRAVQSGIQVSESHEVGLDLKLKVGQPSVSLKVVAPPVVAAVAPPSPMVRPVPPMPTGPVRVSSGVMAGALISKADPVYPAEAKAMHLQGVVVLHVLVTRLGTVGNVEVVSGPPALIVSAIDAVRQWKYSPYLLNGEPIEVDTTIRVNYKMGETDDSQGQGAASASEPQTGPHAAADELPNTASLRLADGTIPPKVIYQVEPEYSQEARRAKASGVVLVNLTVDQQGMPRNVRIARALGHGLDRKALEAVRQYRFLPAMKDNEPVEEPINMEINFKIF